MFKNVLVLYGKSPRKYVDRTYFKTKLDQVHTK